MIGHNPQEKKAMEKRVGAKDIYRLKESRQSEEDQTCAAYASWGQISFALISLLGEFGIRIPSELCGRGVVCQSRNWVSQGQGSQRKIVQVQEKRPREQLWFSTVDANRSTGPRAKRLGCEQLRGLRPSSSPTFRASRFPFARPLMLLPSRMQKKVAVACSTRVAGVARHNVHGK
jgi:hypothetical protein